MFTSINENKKRNCIHITCPTKNIHFIGALLNKLDVSYVAVFIDENNYFGFNKDKKYTLLRITTVSELLQNKDLPDHPLLIFENCIIECYVNKELEMFNKSKFMIELNFDEGVFEVFINTLNTQMSLQQIKQLYHRCV